MRKRGREYIAQELIDVRLDASLTKQAARFTGYKLDECGLVPRCILREQGQKEKVEDKEAFNRLFLSPYSGSCFYFQATELGCCDVVQICTSENSQQSRFSLPKASDGRVPPSLCFPSANRAVASDGNDKLYVFDTSNDGSSETWHLLYSSGIASGPFTLLHACSVQSNENTYYHCLASQWKLRDASRNQGKFKRMSYECCIYHICLESTRTVIHPLVFMKTPPAFARIQQTNPELVLTLSALGEFEMADKSFGKEWEECKKEVAGVRGSGKQLEQEQDQEQDQDQKEQQESEHEQEIQQEKVDAATLEPQWPWSDGSSNVSNEGNEKDTDDTENIAASTPASSSESSADETEPKNRSPLSCTSGSP